MSRKRDRVTQLLTDVPRLDLMVKGKKIILVVPVSVTHDLRIMATITSRRKVRL